VPSDTRSIFRSIAPESQQDLTIKWHNREITGRVYMRDLLDTIKRSGNLPSVNSAETGLDFAVYISNVPVEAELDKLIKDKGDPRILYWSPDALSSAEEALLLDFGAYQEMVNAAQGKETAKARLILDWVQGRLNAHIGPIYRIVTDSYGRGRIAAVDHSSLTFHCQGELSSILTPLVGQVLDSTYLCRDMQFDAPAPFNDQNAINVINGIVRAGEFPRNQKPPKEVSASQNYGFALGIMRKPNDHKLDLRDCRYTQDLMDWIEEKSAASSAGLNASTVYRNFMGIGGPNGINYGLSKRMLQLYLLCLAHEGRIRITLSGRNLPADAIDYTNIGAVDFKVAVLDAFDQVQRLKPPEGWEVLAPFAAILLEDEAVKAVREEAEIQAALRRLLEYKAQALPEYRKLRKGLVDLFAGLQQPLPGAERLAAWETLLSGPVDAADPIPFFRSSLEKAFGYPVYHDELVQNEDLDDFTLRQGQVEQAGRFYTHREAFRAAMRYLAVEVPEEADLADLKRSLDGCRSKLVHLEAWLNSEPRLQNEFLAPMAEAIALYRVRYLQAFDQVVSHTEQARQHIAELEQGREFCTLQVLAGVPGLGAPGPGGDATANLRQALRQAAVSSELFPAALTRAAIERDLPYWPQPSNCPLTLGNSAEWIGRAGRVLETCRQALAGALHEKAFLLDSPALQARLVEHQAHPFIAALLAAKDVTSLAAVLIDGLTDTPQAEENREALARALRRLMVRRINLGDFCPSLHTIEAGDLDAVTAEFRRFLAGQLQASGEDTAVIEVE